MDGTRILVSGLNGFVGQHLAVAARALLPGAELVGLDCDVAEPAAVRSRVAAVRPGACLHLAAVAAVGVARREPDRAWAVNLGGSLNLARAMADVVPGAPLLFSSSADAYGGSFRRGAVDEDAPLAPMNAYGATKAAADLALGAMAAERILPVVRFRAFNHTGPGQGAEFAVPAFARQLALIAAGRQEKVLRTGNLDAIRDFLDVRDVARAYAETLRRVLVEPELARNGLVLNVASGAERRIGDVLDRMVELSGLELRRELDPARARPADIPRAVGNAERLRALLGWAPLVPWEQTLADVLADWRVRVAAEG
ncbi:MAG: GDP-mannose 4,6-dehydratase [Gluconacetobacter diazotrophicus]|nr:GDP-mannose 4,6-dehydratase [Gluconacetobacter diazotrophicus]